MIHFEIDSCQNNLSSKLLGNHCHLASIQSSIQRYNTINTEIRGVSWGSRISPILFTILLMVWMKKDIFIYLADNMQFFLTRQWLTPNTYCQQKQWPITHCGCPKSNSSHTHTSPSHWLTVSLIDKLTKHLNKGNTGLILCLVPYIHYL